MNWKPWAVGAAITAATVIAQAFASTDLTEIADLRAWAVGVAAATVRQVAVFIVRKLGESVA